MKNRYVYDLDNTLIYTDSLNNLSYNYALCQIGLAEISNSTRITRDVVFQKYPRLDITQKSEILRLKQLFFVNNLIYTKSNLSLLHTLNSQSPENCILWTGAEKIRVSKLLEHYLINDKFRIVFFSKKIDITKDVEEICTLFKCNCDELFFYEDNQIVINELRRLNLMVQVV